MKKIQVLLLAISVGVISNAQNVSLSSKKIEQFSATFNSRFLVHPESADLLIYSDNSVYRSSDDGDNWTIDNDLNFPGNGTVRMSTDDPSLVYAGRHRMHRSVNGGKNFMELPEYPEGSGMHMYDMAIMPGHPEVVYVAMDETFLMSDNYGMEWQDLTTLSNGLPEATQFKKIFISEQDTSFMLVSTQSGGLYKTANGGESWAYCGPNYESGQLTDFYTFNKGDTIFLIEGDKLFKSTNKGVAWTEEYVFNNEEGKVISYNPGDSTTFLILWDNMSDCAKLLSKKEGESFSLVHTFKDYNNCFQYVNYTQYKFFYGKDKDSRIFLAGDFGLGGLEYIFSTSDNGATWEALNNGIYNFGPISDFEITNDNKLLATEANAPAYHVLELETNTHNRYKTYQREWATSIVLDSTTNTAHMVLDFGIAKLSSDFSSSVKVNSSDPIHAGSAISIDYAEDKNIIYSAIDRNYTNSQTALFRSKNDGLFAEIVCPETNSEIKDITFLHNNSNDMCLATKENGYFLRDSANFTWSHYANPGNINSVTFHNNILYFAADDAIYKSIDYGLTSEKITTWPAKQVIVHPDNENLLIASSDELLKYSLDGGNSWIEYNIDSNYIKPKGNLILKFHPDNPELLYVMTENIGLYEIQMLRIDSLITSTVDCATSKAGIEVYAKGFAAPLQYSIDNGGSFQTSNEFLNVEPGEYHIKVKDATGSIVSWNESILFKAPVKVDLGNDFAICEGGDAILDAGDFASYSWSNDSATPTITVAKHGEYFVSVMDENDCLSKDTIFITINEIDTTTQVISICENEEYLGFSATGKHYLKETAITGCDSIIEIDLTVNPLPEISIGADAEITTDEVLDLKPAQDYEEYVWSTDETTKSINLVGSEVGEGNHEFWLQVTDIHGCKNSDTINVTISGTIGVINFNDNTVEVYPNPTKGIINIDLSGNNNIKTNIVIRTIHGVSVLKKEFNSNTDSVIDISQFNPGLYIISVYSGNNERVFRLVKK